MPVGYTDMSFLGNQTYIFEDAPYAFCIIVDFLPLTIVVLIAIYVVHTCFQRKSTISKMKIWRNVLLVFLWLKMT